MKRDDSFKIMKFSSLKINDKQLQHKLKKIYGNSINCMIWSREADY